MKFSEYLRQLIDARKDGRASRGIMAFTGKMEGRHLAHSLGIAVPELWATKSLSAEEWIEEPPWAGCVVKPVDGSNSRGVVPLERHDSWRGWRSLLGDGIRSWTEWRHWLLEQRGKHATGPGPWKGPMIVEELIERRMASGFPLLPYDFKIYCIAGVAIWMNQIDKTSSRDATTYRTRHWWIETKRQLTPAKEPIIIQPRVQAELPSPRQLEDLVESAEKVARYLHTHTDSPFVRVDLYESDQGTVYFGEVTPHPSGGNEVYAPKADRALGELWGELVP